MLQFGPAVNRPVHELRCYHLQVLESDLQGIGEPPLSDATVLIPAAGRVSEGLMAFSNVATPAMIPVAGAPVIHWTLKSLTELGATRFRIAVPERGLSVEDHAECVFGDVASFEWVVPNPTGSAGSTVARLLDGVDGPAMSVLGDTLFSFGAALPDFSRAWVMTSPVEESDRWCIIECDERGRVVSWHNKRAGLAQPLEAAVGVYWLPHGIDSAEVEALLARPDPIEISTVIERATGDQPVYGVRAGTWLDCGNPDTQEATRRTMLQERTFNQLSFDGVNGTIRKSSTSKEKFIDEVNYLRLLPDDVSVLFPRVVKDSTEWSDPWVVLEYVGYPTLTELFLFGNLRAAAWMSIFDRLSTTLERFREHERPIPVGDLHEMYVGKTRRRLDECAGLAHLDPLLHVDDLMINGRRRRPLTALVAEAERHLERLADNSVGAIVHGDFCFSNILYDVRTGVCKLIDPRGSFGRVGIHGDQRYDVAKLHHSLLGSYDHIVAGLYQFDLDGRDVRLKVFRTPAQERVCAQYRSQILEHWNTREIDLITGLIFASLPAMHTESADRQSAFVVQAIELLSTGLGMD